MIVASSGHMAPVSGHDHDVTRAAGRILERLMSLRSQRTFVTDGTRCRAALKAWMPHSCCVSDMAGTSTPYPLGVGGEGGGGRGGGGGVGGVEASRAGGLARTCVWVWVRLFAWVF